MSTTEKPKRRRRNLSVPKEKPKPAAEEPVPTLVTGCCRNCGSENGKPLGILKSLPGPGFRVEIRRFQCTECSRLYTQRWQFDP